MSSHRLSPSGRAHLHELAEERERDWHGRFVSDGVHHSHPRYLTSAGRARLRELAEEKLEGHMHHSPYLTAAGKARLRELAEERLEDGEDGYMHHSHHSPYLTAAGKARVRELVEEKLEGHMHHAPYLTSAGKMRLRELAEERLGSVVHHHHYYGDHHRGWNAAYEPRDWHGRFMSSSNRSSASKKLKKPGRSPRSLAASSRPRNELGQFMSY